MSVVFKDFTKIVLDKIHDTGETFLEEVGGEVESQTKRNTKVADDHGGKTKDSWDHIVNTDKMEVQIGSRYKNALWEELGTGIYALNGDGRKTKWVYRTEDGKFYATVGKKPRRALFRAYQSKKNAIIREAKRRFGKI